MWSALPEAAELPEAALGSQTLINTNVLLSGMFPEADPRSPASSVALTPQLSSGAHCAAPCFRLPSCKTRALYSPNDLQGLSQALVFWGLSWPTVSYLSLHLVRQNSLGVMGGCGAHGLSSSRVLIYAWVTLGKSAPSCRVGNNGICCR